MATTFIAENLDLTASIPADNVLNDTALIAACNAFTLFAESSNFIFPLRVVTESPSSAMLFDVPLNFNLSFRLSSDVIVDDIPFSNFSLSNTILTIRSSTFVLIF